jgi:hypothetical protein
MEPVTLIVTALAAGTASALHDGTAVAVQVKDAYVRLKVPVKKRFANRPDRELVLARHERAPQTLEAPLAAELSAAGSESDADLVAAAQALMSLVDEAGTRTAKCPVDLLGTQGVQVGTYNIQDNTFNLAQGG